MCGELVNSLIMKVHKRRASLVPVLLIVRVV